MKSFKQYLEEMPGHAQNAPDYLDDVPVRKPYDTERLEYTGHSFGNYNLKAKSYKSKDSPEERHKPYEYQAEHDNDEVHMVTRGGTTKDNYFIANETRKHSDSEVKAADFYKEILHHGVHSGIQSGTEQTDGGKGIWHNLAHKHDDVEVTHHEYPSMKQIKLHTGNRWDDNFSDEKNTVFRMRLKK